jgi:hypothetical protein
MLIVHHRLSNPRYPGCMRRLVIVCVGLGLAGIVGSGCGSADDFESGGGAAGAAGNAGASNGGSAGSSTRRQRGSSTGGSAGSSTGGSAGSSTGGSAGSSTGGSSGGTSAGCPAVEPTQDAACTEAGQVCCYAPIRPDLALRASRTRTAAAPSLGEAQFQVCCPATAPEIGNECNTPGDLKCCYEAAAGFYCNGQPEPDVWAAATCN